MTQEKSSSSFKPIRNIDKEKVNSSFKPIRELTQEKSNSSFKPIRSITKEKINSSFKPIKEIAKSENNHILLNDNMISEIGKKIENNFKKINEAPFCRDFSQKILEELKRNNYRYKSNSLENLETAIGYITNSICCNIKDKGKLPDLKNLTHDKTKDTILDIYEYLNKPTKELIKTHLIAEIKKNPKLEVLNINKIRENIKNIDWDKISSDWSVKSRVNQFSEYKTLQLDPNKECSEENPLFRHKEWMERIYNDKTFQMTDKRLAELCRITKKKAYHWRKRVHEIKGKTEWGEGRFIDKRSERIYIRVPKEYNHPELKPYKGRKRGFRLEHIYKMERFLKTKPNLEVSKKLMIDGKYLKVGCEIHHINHNHQDNRIENLWVYESKSAHNQADNTLKNCLMNLIKSKQIEFENGCYKINETKGLNNKPLNLNNNIKSTINFKNIDNIKEDIKKIKWSNITNDWTVKNRSQTVNLDPNKDCSEENPLYRHKIWVETIVSDSKYNLTDSRLGKLCEISRDKARHWRGRVHNIPGKKDWGYDRFVDKSDGRIWTKVPSDYANPVVKKDDHQRKFMLEHRYIMEQFLTQHPEFDISEKVLIDGKYLKNECQVHHINFDCQDNRIENLFVFENDAEHWEATRSLYSLVEDCLNNKKIIFKDGEYFLYNE